MSVAICILTYKRPDGLRSLLKGIARLEFKTSPPPKVKVIVIDNDAEGTAVAQCAELASTYRWPLHAEIEHQRGIPHARNRALRCARDSQFVVFIDDDEVPTPRWLDELIIQQQAFDADAVLGPVLPEFNSTPPRWIEQGRFFIKDNGGNLPAGAALHARQFRTSNVLLRNPLLPTFRFDERYPLTGGTDTLFGIRFEKANKKIIWAPDAVIYETIPDSRANLSWILRRAFRLGITSQMFDLEYMTALQSRIFRVFAGTARVLLGLILLPFAILLIPFTGKLATVKRLRTIARGLGMLAGAFQLQHNEYSQTHTT